MDLINGFGRASSGFRFRSANRVGQGSGVATVLLDLPLGLVWARPNQTARISNSKFVLKIDNLSITCWSSLLNLELGLGWASKMVSQYK